MGGGEEDLEFSMMEMDGHQKSALHLRENGGSESPAYMMSIDASAIQFQPTPTYHGSMSGAERTRQPQDERNDYTPQSQKSSSPLPTTSPNHHHTPCWHTIRLIEGGLSASAGDGGLDGQRQSKCGGEDR